MRGIPPTSTCAFSSTSRARGTSSTRISPRPTRRRRGGKEADREELRRQIAQAECVIALPGLYRQAQRSAAVRDDLCQGLGQAGDPHAAVRRERGAAQRRSRRCRIRSSSGTGARSWTPSRRRRATKNPIAGTRSSSSWTELSGPALTTGSSLPAANNCTTAAPLLARHRQLQFLLARHAAEHAHDVRGMTLGFLVGHLADGRAHRVFTAQRAFALHRRRQFEELQAHFARHVVRFDVGEVLAPRAFSRSLMPPPRASRSVADSSRS